VVLVTDSSACLPPAFFYSSHVRVVPIRIILPNGYLKETPEAIDEIYRALAAREPVTSSPPTLPDYLGSIEEGVFDEALVLTPAREFTGMHHVASMAAILSDRPVEVVDTRSIAAAQYLVAAAALGAVAGGAGAAEAAEVARRAAARTAFVAALPERGSMPRAARIAFGEPAGQIAFGEPAGQIAFGEPAGHRRGLPLVRLRDGVVTPLSDAAPGSDGLDSLKAAWLGSGGSNSEETVVFHGASEPRALQLSALLGGLAEIVPLSPSLALQMGVGCIGVAWTEKAKNA